MQSLILNKFRNKLLWDACQMFHTAKLYKKWYHEPVFEVVGHSKILY